MFCKCHHGCIEQNKDYSLSIKGNFLFAGGNDLPILQKDSHTTVHDVTPYAALLSFRGKALCMLGFTRSINALLSSLIHSIQQCLKAGQRDCLARGLVRSFYKTASLTWLEIRGVESKQHRFTDKLLPSKEERGNCGWKS